MTQRTEPSNLAPTWRDRPPFRADHVEVCSGRDHFSRPGHGSPPARSTTRRCARPRTRPSAEVVGLQRDAGLQTATDGEFRRTSWHMDFIYQLEGVGSTDEKLQVHFHNADGDLDFEAAALRVARPGPARGHDLRRRRSGSSRRPPRRPPRGSPRSSPSRRRAWCTTGAAGRRSTRASTRTLDAFWTDLSAAYAEQVRRVAAARLHLPPARRHQPGLPERPEAARDRRGAGRRRRAPARAATSAPSTRPSRTVRTACTSPRTCAAGNYRSSWAAEGGYDFVAEALFSRAGRRRLLPGVRRRAVRRLRAPALRAGGQAGRPRPGHHEARCPRGQGHLEAPHRRGGAVRPARPALPLTAVRLLLDRGGQHPDPTTRRSRSSG